MKHAVKIDAAAVVKAFEMEMGAFGYIVNCNDAPQYNGMLVLRTYFGLVCLTEPNEIWSPVDNDKWAGKLNIALIPKGAVITLTVGGGD